MEVGDQAVIVKLKGAEQKPGAELEDQLRASLGQPTLPGGFEVTYKGPGRSFGAEGKTFQRGVTVQIGDVNLAARLTKTKGFQVIMSGRKAEVKAGRILTIYARQEHALMFHENMFDGGISSTEVDTKEFIDSYLICTVDGLVAEAAEVRPPTKEEAKELEAEELNQVMSGKVPYRKKLVPKGKGRWGVPEPEKEYVVPVEMRNMGHKKGGW